MAMTVTWILDECFFQASAPWLGDAAHACARMRRISFAYAIVILH
jgi:hypothetical protein